MKLSPSYFFIIVISIAPALISCNTDGQSKDTTSKDTTAAIPVEKAEVTRGTISAYYNGTAALEAEVEAGIVSKVRGIVESIHVEEGDIVEKNQILAELEDEQVSIEVQRAKATMNKLKNEFERNKKQFEKNLISAEAFENSRFEYESQRAEYELAALNLRNAKIRTPIEGVVAERMIKQGTTVDQNEEIFRISDFTPLIGILHVPEHQMNRIKSGQTALFQVDARPNEQFRGYVQRISPVVDPETGTFKVTVAVEDESHRLRPGMFSRIRIVYDQHENVLLVPKQALIEEDTDQYVFVIEDQIAYKRPVQTGYINQDHTEILSGLEMDDQVVTIGQSSLQDSTRVEIVEPRL